MRNKLLLVQAAALVVVLIVLIVLVAVRSGSAAARADAPAGKVADLAARLEAESRQLADARRQGEALQQGYVNLTRDLDSARADRRQAEARAQGLQGQLEKASSGESQRLAEARQRADTLQASFAAVSRDLEALRLERRQTETRLAQCQTQLDQVSKADAQLLAEAQRRADSLYQLAANLSRNLETVRAERRQADACVQELLAQIDQAGKSGGSTYLTTMISEARRRAELLQQVQSNLSHDLDAVRIERRLADSCALQLRARLGDPTAPDAPPANWLVGLLGR